MGTRVDAQVKDFRGNLSYKDSTFFREKLPEKMTELEYKRTYLQECGTPQNPNPVDFHCYKDFISNKVFVIKVPQKIEKITGAKGENISDI
jgi:hypothetical protein